MPSALRMLLAVGAAGTAAVAGAMEVLPLRTANQNPLIAIHDLPPDEGATVLRPGAARLEFALDISNSYATDDSPREDLVLDGETHRATLRYRHGFDGGWQFGIDLPWLAHDGGFLDGFIYNWHEFFGLKQHGRDTVENDRLEYRYVRDGLARVKLDARRSGIGDIRFGVGRRWLDATSPVQLAAHASLTLPTGNIDALLGNGSMDISAWLSAQTLLPGNLQWTAYGSAGVLFPGESDVLPELTKSLAGFGSLGLAWQAAAWITFQVQLNGHTPLYDEVEVRPLESSSLQLALGGALRFTPNTRLDLAIVEDAVIGTAPDVSFHLNLRRNLR